MREGQGVVLMCTPPPHSPGKVAVDGQTPQLRVLSFGHKQFLFFFALLLKSINYSKLLLYQGERLLIYFLSCQSILLPIRAVMCYLMVTAEPKQAFSGIRFTG